jgi:hypothetical protein
MSFPDKYSTVVGERGLKVMKPIYFGYFFSVLCFYDILFRAHMVLLLQISRDAPIRENPMLFSYMITCQVNIKLI